MSVVVRAAVRVVAPFAMTFGLFTAFHGTSSVGGGFQGGVVVAATAVLLALAFGRDAAERWLDVQSLGGAAAVGVVALAVVVLAPLSVGAGVLDLRALPVAVVYAVELAELGIAVAVAATLTALFSLLEGGAA
ncbi:MnhB domain-containing protein [Halomicrococcus sp. SG-WS-1]|uniref:MnhB domain-containing protein n=1 Tax=Halomicrococcus sp. SG-WS-1 TaxID=3439057 RepID=UPI003F79C155